MEGPDSAPIPPPPPRRVLDTASLEGLNDLVSPDSNRRNDIQSRDFPELQGQVVSPAKVDLVLFDGQNVDSTAAAFAARQALRANARYESVSHGMSMADLSTDCTGKIVAFLGVYWPPETMHELTCECEGVFILETHLSAIRELEELNYLHVIRIFEPSMGCAALSWNFFHSNTGMPVPALFRMIEDGDLSRGALMNSNAFFDGLEEEREQVTADRYGLLTSDDPVFQQIEDLVNEDRAAIQRIVDSGLSMQKDIIADQQQALANYTVRSPRAFPSLRCAMIAGVSPFDARVAECLCKKIAQGDKVKRSIGIVFHVSRHFVKVVLWSVPREGPDVSELARKYGGGGHAHLARFSVAVDNWASVWLPTERILWDVNPCSNGLALQKGEEVVVLARNWGFKGKASELWSWGYSVTNPADEGWFPTLSHSLFVASVSLPSAGAGIQALKEGDLIVAHSMKGLYYYGAKFTSYFGLGSQSDVKKLGWFPVEGSLRPVCPHSTKELTATCQ